MLFEQGSHSQLDSLSVAGRHPYKRKSGLKIHSVLQQPNCESWSSVLSIRKEDTVCIRIFFCLLNIISSGLHLPGEGSFF